MADALTPSQFAARIRAKYPGAYDSVSDDELTTRVLAKYPVYRDSVQMSSPPAQQPYEPEFQEASGFGLDPTRQRGYQPPPIGQMAVGAMKSLPTTGGMTGFEQYDDINQAMRQATQPQTPAEQTGMTIANVGQALPGISAGFEAAGSLANVLRGMTPTAMKQAAGGLFKQASSAAGKLAVNPEAAGQAALEAQELQAAGRTMPRTLSRFLQRVTDPSKGPPTYDEARNFYSAMGELSADEKAKYTPAMKRLLNQTRVNLGQAINETAQSAGVGQQYQQAMTGYHKAKAIDEFVDAFKGAAAEYGRGVLRGMGLGTGALPIGVAGYKIYKGR